MEPAPLCTYVVPPFVAMVPIGTRLIAARTLYCIEREGTCPPSRSAPLCVYSNAMVVAFSVYPFMFIAANFNDSSKTVFSN